MTALTWRAWILLVIVVVGLTTLTFAGLRAGAHLWQDHLDYHLVIEVLKYNIQQGRLAPLPGPSGTPQAPEPK